MAKTDQAAVAERKNDLDELHHPPAYHAAENSGHAADPPSNYTVFPRDTVIYRKEYISLILGPQYEANKPQPPALFYVSVHMDNRWFNKSHTPQIRLHFGPDDTYPVIGSVKFRHSTTSEITINLNPTSPNSEETTEIELTKTWAAMSDVHKFYHTVRSPDGTLAKEKFEWRHSSDPEVKALATENHPGENITQDNKGLKLVRDSTGEMLAAFCGGKHQRNWNPKRVAGKLRFSGSTLLDPLVIVMSILSIMERSRRNAVYHASDLYGCTIS